jgi:hypothetical protein
MEAGNGVHIIGVAIDRLRVDEIDPVAGVQSHDRMGAEIVEIAILSFRADGCGLRGFCAVATVQESK